MNSFIKNNRVLQVINIVLFSLTTTSALAIEHQDPEFFQVGDFFLIPSLSVNESYNNNIFLQDNGRKDSAITVINPKARVAYEGEYSLTTLDVSLNKGFYHSSSSDNYLDTGIKIGTEMFPSERVQFGASLARTEGHDNRGVGLQDGLSAFDFNSPHEYYSVIGLADLEYGTRVEGAARLEAAISLEDKKYENHRTVTSTLDRDTGNVTVGLFYMLAPATSILIEGRYGDIDYDTATADSKEYQAMIGLEWEATYQTTGFIKLGVGRKDFASATRTDSTEPAWEVGVDWSPLSYSIVTLRTAKGFDEGEGTGNYVDVQTVSIDWRHDWYDHIGTQVMLEYKTDEYGGSFREDDISSMVLGADYQYNPWVLVNAGIIYEERDSTLFGFDYNNTIYSLNFKLNL